MLEERGASVKDRKDGASDDRDGTPAPPSFHSAPPEAKSVHLLFNGPRGEAGGRAREMAVCVPGVLPPPLGSP